jgi:hypothetical protein
MKLDLRTLAAGQLDGIQPPRQREVNMIRSSGSRWSVARTPNRCAGDRFLPAVAASPARTLAVGSSLTSSGTERWRSPSGGTAGRADCPTVSPGRGDDMLFGVTAGPGRPTSWAVGTASGQALIERYR